MKPAALIWLVALAFLLCAEFVLLALGQPLLSHAVWEFIDQNHTLSLLVSAIIGALWAHFFWSRRK